MTRKPAPDLEFLKREVASGAPAGSSLFAAGTGATLPVGELPVDILDDNTYQPAQRGDPTAVAELAEVIGQQGFHGELLAREHPSVDGHYQLAFGHQRRDAARMAGLRSVPVEVQELTDAEMAEVVVTENIHRQDLDPLQEAGLYRVLQTVFGLTQQQIAERAGKKRVYIAKRLALLDAPADVHDLLREKPDSLRAAEDLRHIEDPQVRGELIAGFQAGHLTTNDIAIARRARAAQRGHSEAAPASAPGGDPARRARLLKLNTALESLSGYAEQTATAGDISPEEYTKLELLRERVEQLLHLGTEDVLRRTFS